MRVRLSLFIYESDCFFSDYVPCREDGLKVDSEAGSLRRKYMERKKKMSLVLQFFFSPFEPYFSYLTDELPGSFQHQFSNTNLMSYNSVLFSH